MKKGYPIYAIITAVMPWIWVAGLNGQEPDLDRRSITIVYPDSTVKAAMLTTIIGVKIKSDRMYYWIYDEQIYHNRGGYAHYLLDGEYRVFSKENMLITKGAFENGLKNGSWKSWHLNGELKLAGYYDKGRKQGHWYYYDSSGTQLSRLRYRDDLLSGKCIGYEEGEKTETYYRHGKVRQTLLQRLSGLFPGRKEEHVFMNELSDE